MDLVSKVVPVLIASLFSVVVAIISFTIAYKKLKAESKHLQTEREHRFIDKLFERRIILYPTAFELAGKINQERSPKYISHQDDLLRVKYDIVKWAESEAGLFMSQELVAAYYDLIGVLGKNPGNGANYTKGQAEKIWKARNVFRSQLRNDLGNLHWSFFKNRT